MSGTNPNLRGSPYEPEVDVRFASLESRATSLEALPANASYTADGISNVRVARITYDFAVNGGAVSTIDLGGALPAKALVRQGWAYVNTAVTSGGTPGVSFGIGASTTNLLGSADITSTFTGGAVALIPVGTAAAMVASAAGGNLKMVIGTAALTAGKFTVFLEYVVTN